MERSVELWVAVHRGSSHGGDWGRIKGTVPSYFGAVDTSALADEQGEVFWSCKRPFTAACLRRCEVALHFTLCQASLYATLRAEGFGKSGSGFWGLEKIPRRWAHLYHRACGEGKVRQRVEKDQAVSGVARPIS
jgi:hypothetical protein